MNNDEKLKEQMKSAPVPDELRPENIKIMLDNEKARKKRSGISIAGRITAAAAAFAVIGGTAAYTMNNGRHKATFDSTNIASQEKNDAKSADHADSNTDNEPDSKKQANYMNSADSYEQVYTMFRRASRKAKKDSARTQYRFKTDDEDIKEYDAVETVEEVEPGTVAAGDDLYSGMNDTGAGIGGGSEIRESPVVSAGGSDDGANDEPASPAKEDEPANEEPQHSETYYQEQDVLEADIVKTDGKHIYYLGAKSGGDYSSTPLLRTADVKDGKFTGSTTIDICGTTGIEDNGYNVCVLDMYIYNDMIAVIGNNNNSNFYYGIDYRDMESSTPYTFVAFYTTGEAPRLIDVYKQDGYYNDVRISPEGFMLLTSSYTTPMFDYIGDSSDTRKYIPYCGFAESYDIMPCEDILLPIDGFGSTNNLSYTVLTSLDLNNPGSPAAKDTKTLAGYAGSIYCSANNLYTAAFADLNKTDITRISINGGEIVPEAGVQINGVIKDQFSMSEYGGYFRVAATYTEIRQEFHTYAPDAKDFLKDVWDSLTGEERQGYYTYENVKTDTRVYVFDMDMNMVGSIGDLGVGEQLKSASFSGNMAYVVTFRQTDPLYAVDLSDPANPALLDEFKINGFSTYMQQWSDGLLFGFGLDADDNGFTNGIRMTMFDNSDPNDLKAQAVYTWSNSPDNYIYDADFSERSEEYYNSCAVDERKALLLAPEKNLIGVPITYTRYSFTNSGKESEFIYESKYVFFSYENGEFVQKGEISSDIITDSMNAWNSPTFNRALYIGDHVYALSSDRFVAADISTLDITDELKF